MAVVNIVDHRKRPYRFSKINVVLEATWHDNLCEAADQVTVYDGPDYADREHITLEEALKWGNEFAGQNTLYLYDDDGGIYPSHEHYRGSET